VSTLAYRGLAPTETITPSPRDGNDVHGDPMASEELEHVGWHSVEREAFASFRGLTRFMLAQAIALRKGTASGEAPLFFRSKNACRTGICRETAGAT
jgi:hypothetical protein